jgi:hypothetical protein
VAAEPPIWNINAPRPPCRYTAGCGTGLVCVCGPTLPHQLQQHLPEISVRCTPVTTPGAAFQAPPWHALLKVDRLHPDQNVDTAPTVRAAPMTKREEAALDRVLELREICPGRLDCAAGPPTQQPWGAPSASRV